MTAVEIYETKTSQCRGHVGGAFQPENCTCKTEWRFRIRAANNEIIAASEGYTSKQGAERGVDALRRALMPESLAYAWEKGVTAGEANVLMGNGGENPYRQQEPPCS